ncbi:TPA: hypothetical protein DEW47_04015 [Patescibacteria group bacterium]|nr:MAG: hypothetical protein UT71_C0003G0015 [Parcubacteria group bacterium GW2011_GWF2_40_10]KKR47973.1 MAG: hypothetical protein UT83_C0001G0016 [Parcubacteria group bacterium GW2011_GWA2_40_143]KKR60453.1 MAG: hypothetical protein UT97_C0001G0024 [Parcubacteria group bacterium GW2011_GWC2_40_31]KKR74789.1 MAG: hypothetical protein UU18_C0019G0013 [Parcubacteria group bacterium GW2011_GWB2_40_8]KKR77576.1 MAG: hypothetical protein UU20_C0004G0013 [Parcubacteria group bacterium GW2011_GWE2_40_
MSDQKEFSNDGACSGDTIQVLKGQHVDLKNKLKEISDEIKKSRSDFGDIPDKLRKFNIELANHAEFENCAFYQPLLKKMEGQGFDIDDIKEFIAEMTKLLNVVKDFTQRYDKAEMIQNDTASFSSDLSAAMAELETRIVAEEDGVFIYW